MDEHPSASSLGIIAKDPARETAMTALASKKPDAERLLSVWLDKEQREIEKARTPIAKLGLMMDLAALYEEASLAKRALAAYEDAREMAWQEHMDGLIRTLDEKIKRFRTFG